MCYHKNTQDCLQGHELCPACSRMFLLRDVNVISFLFSLHPYPPPSSPRPHRPGPLHRRRQRDPQPGPGRAQLGVRADLPGRRQRAHRVHGRAHQDQPHLLDQLAHEQHLLLRAAFLHLRPLVQLPPPPTRGHRLQPAGGHPGGWGGQGEGSSWRERPSVAPGPEKTAVDCWRCSVLC